MFDYHVHSDFSADCDTPMEETIEQAIANGLEEICFTEHIDLDYPDPTIQFELDQIGYDQKIKQMQSKYAGSIRIKKGVEIGVQPHQLDDYHRIITEDSFDFVICSMHTTAKKDLHSGHFFEGKTVEEAFRQYYAELLYCVQHFQDYQVLGNLDLVKRYVKRESKDACHDLIAEIFKEIIPLGKGIELNTSGYRYGLDGGLPSVDILKLYRDLGGEIITFGSDSHIASTIGYQLNESLDLLSSLGFTQIATFKNQQVEMHSIKKLTGTK